MQIYTKLRTLHLAKVKLLLDSNRKLAERETQVYASACHMAALLLKGAFVHLKITKFIYCTQICNHYCNTMRL